MRPTCGHSECSLQWPLAFLRRAARSVIVNAHCLGLSQADDDACLALMCSPQFWHNARGRLECQRVPQAGALFKQRTVLARHLLHGVRHASGIVTKALHFALRCCTISAIPLLKDESPCRFCMQPIQVDGNHATCCAKSGAQLRHNDVRDMVVSLAYSPVTREARHLWICSWPPDVNDARSGKLLEL